MVSKIWRATSIALLALTLLVVSACGSTRMEETGQSKAVRDRSRVLGLALMEDGTYQFRLCRLHKTYTAEVLANECINPFVNEDGAAKAFKSVPVKPGTALATFRNWSVALLMGVVTGAVIYKLGRYYVKLKAKDRLVGNGRLLQHKEMVSVARTRNDYELVERLQALDTATVAGNDAAAEFASFAGDFVDGYRNIDTSLKTALDRIEAALATTPQQQANWSETLVGIQGALRQASDVSATLGQAEAGFRFRDGMVQEIERLAAQADELTETAIAKMGDDLQQLKESVSTLHSRLQAREGLRLNIEQRQTLHTIAAATDDATLQSLGQRGTELNLLNNSDEFERVVAKLKDGNDELVEKIIRVEEAAGGHAGYGETIVEIKRLMETGQGKQEYAKAMLEQRVKSYNPAQRTEIIDTQAKVGAAIKAEEAAPAKPASSDAKAGLFANSLGGIGDFIRRRVSFMRGFPWIGEDTLKYGKLNKITVTDEDAIVTKLARGDEVKVIEVQKGVEKLTGQVLGVAAFLSLPLTEWSRYLPAYSLLSAERNWEDVTSGYETATRIDDLQAILDGIAQATNSRVAPTALIFGR